jgi:epidermal growth factor receptor substrate 15
MYLIQGSMSANPTIPVLPPSLPVFLWEQAGGRPPSVHSHTTGESLPSPKLPPSGMAGVGVPRTFTPQYTGGSGTSHQPGSTIGSQFTGLTAQTTGSRLPNPSRTGTQFPLTPQLTSGSPFPLARAPAQPAPLPWDITAEEKAKSDGFFDSLDTSRVGYLEGGAAGAFMLLSGLSEEVLAKVWYVKTFDPLCRF